MSIVAFDSQQFRRALGCFATGVTVITARCSNGLPVGMTCNSFASVSLTPPLVQWSIAKTSRNYSTMLAAQHFAVHVLDSNQQGLCKQFAGREGDRFANTPLELGLHELPLLTRYHARFECVTHARHDAGDHTIIIGHVLRLCEQEGMPLIFYRGEFFALAPAV